MQRVIGLVGFIGSGKNTVSNILVSEFGFTPLSYAASLKDALSSIFGWDRNLLEGLTDESRKWRDKVDKWWESRLGIDGFTPRIAMQQVGTNVLRQYFNEDIWVASLEKKVANIADNVVVTDCRFPNEISTIKKMNGSVIRVKRGDDPEWFVDALCYNSGKKNYKWATSRDKLKKQNIHESEYAWIGQSIDVEIENNGDISELKQKIMNYIH